MSDFTSNFWSVFVASITVLSILACLVLLIVTGKSKGVVSDDGTTGHVWDGDLRELNNPLPRWWSYLFVITVVFAFAYLALYPGLGTYAGKFGWSSGGQLQSELDKGQADLVPIYARFSAMKVEDLARDAPAMAIGERLFLNNCAPCHGSDARGNKDFPNLTDNDWLGGGTPEIIKADITNGRLGVMPPMAASVGSADDVKNLAQYVLSLSASPHDSARAALGKPKFAACAACHGADGKGNQALGSANLADDVWLHGYGEAAIVAIINKGKSSQMPAQVGKLTAEQIHLLTAYVWGLSNRPHAPAR